MFWLNGLAAIFAVAISHSDPVGADKSEIRSFTKTWPASNSEQFFPTCKFQNNEANNFTYLTCEPLKSKQSVSCNVSVSSLYTDSTHVYCNDLRMNLKTQNGRHERYMLYYILNSDRILVQWLVTAMVEDETKFGKYIEDKNTSEMKYRIIHLGNCSTISELSIYVNATDPPTHANPMVYNDTFEIVTFSEESCRGMPGCRRTYDFDGKPIGDIRPFNSRATFKASISPLNDQSGNEGHYAIGYDYPNYTKVDRGRLMLELSDFNSSYPPGEPVHLTNMLIFTPIFNFFWTAHSNAHDRFGFCWLTQHVWANPIPTRSARCIQALNHRISMRKIFDVPEAIAWIAARNLADREILVIAGACSDDVTGKKCKGFRVERITNEKVHGNVHEALEVDAGLEFTVPNVETLAHDLSITETNSDEILFSWSITVANATSQTNSLLLHRSWIPKKLIP